MLINDYAGSGGDAMPWFFRQERLGPLVGTRTWGGLVGITGYPPLMDGGSVTAAAFGIMDRDGRWVVENEGVAPDVEVIEWPKDCSRAATRSSRRRCARPRSPREEPAAQAPGDRRSYPGAPGPGLHDLWRGGPPQGTMPSPPKENA